VIVVLDAPTNLGLQPPVAGREPGVARAPAALRALGLVQRLQANDAGAVPAPAYTGERGVDGVLHADAIAGYARALADALAAPLDGATLPLVLGGDCSLLAGPLLALARRGRHGLVFLDGHRDLLLPAQSRSGAAAGMDLAFATGHGPDALVRYDGFDRLVDPADVMLFGHRDADRWYSAELLALADDAMRALPLERARMQDLERVFRLRLDALLARGVAGFWLHLDVDVLDDALMYAVDAREPGGMTFDELVALLRIARESQRLAGLHVTNYDPDRDPDGRCARGLVDALVDALRGL
jgi:arginase